jgi:predicted Zn-dependent protease
MRKKILILLCGVFLITTGCATVYNPITQRQEYTLIDTSTEKSLGTSVSSQIESKYRLVNNPEILSRVRKIGNSVASYSGRHNIHYKFRVLDTGKDEINAVAIPGGHIYLFRKLVEEANDDELACIIGHEIAHVEARHAVKRIQAVLGYQLLMSIAFRGQSHSDMIRYSNTIFNLVAKGYSRRDELEADRVGVKYAYQAGYDPEGMITFLNKLKKLDEYSPYRIEFFSTHPLVENRIKYLQEEIDTLKNKEGV